MKEWILRTGLFLAGAAIGRTMYSQSVDSELRTIAAGPFIPNDPICLCLLTPDGGASLIRATQDKATVHPVGRFDCAKEIWRCQEGTSDGGQTL